MAQIIWSTRCRVKVLLDIQQKFYWTSSRAIFLLLDVQQIFTLSSGCLVGSYFSATRHPVEDFYQTSSRKSSTRRLVEQKIWANECYKQLCSMYLPPTSRFKKRRHSSYTYSVLGLQTKNAERKKKYKSTTYLIYLLVPYCETQILLLKYL